MVEQRDPETYAIIGAAMAVHAELGCGFLENVYQCAMQSELRRQAVPSQPQVRIAVTYKGEMLDCYYCADFICFKGIIVEIKALNSISSIERAQVLNYLKATGYHRALLINFGSTSLEFERIVR